jgi:hypothetical protein
MDIHERPYECRDVGCAKLPGFTYPGGLSRHEREVHSVAGAGAPKKYPCPDPGCGKSFARKENMNEHVRRVHRGGGTRETPSKYEESTEFPTGSDRKRRRTDRLAGSVWTCILMVILRFLC